MKHRDVEEEETWHIEVKPERRFGLQGWRAVAVSNRGSRIGNMKSMDGFCFAAGYWRRRREQAIWRIHRDLTEYMEDLDRKAEDDARTLVIPWERGPSAL